MRLSNKIIDEIVAEVAGDDVVPLVQILKNKKNVSEFKLAETIKHEVNATRNMLYRLYDHNLVSFIRKKDKKKGWYIYYWTFDTKKIKPLVISLKKRRLEKLKERLEREKSSHFYSCETKCIRLDFDQAMDFDFRCPECGEIINMEDNSANIEKIQNEMKEIQEELKEELKEEKISKTETEKPERFPTKKYKPKKKSPSKKSKPKKNNSSKKSKPSNKSKKKSKPNKKSNSKKKK